MNSAMQILAFVGVAAGFWSAGLTNNRLLAATLASHTLSENRTEYVVSPCHIRIANMFGGHFSVPYPNSAPPQQGIYHFPATGPFRSSVLYGAFSLACTDARDSERIAIALGAKKINGKWLRYDSLGSWGEPLMPFDAQQHMRVMTLKGVNWTGTGLTVDDTTGEEQTRSRVFSFCLFHKSQALCGKTPVAFLANPKVNELWKVKAILQSIEFVDNSTLGSEVLNEPN